MTELFGRECTIYKTVTDLLVSLPGGRQKLSPQEFRGEEHKVQIWYQPVYQEIKGYLQDVPMDKHIYCLLCKVISHLEHVQWLDSISLKLFCICMFMSGQVEHFKIYHFKFSLTIQETDLL